MALSRTYTFPCGEDNQDWDDSEDLIEILPRAGGTVNGMAKHNLVKKNSQSRMAMDLESSTSNASLVRTMTTSQFPVQPSRSVCAFVNNSQVDDMRPETPEETHKRERVSTDPSCGPRKMASFIHRKRLQKNSNSLLSGIRSSHSSSYPLAASRSEPIEEIIAANRDDSGVSSRRVSAAMGSPLLQGRQSFDESVGVSSSLMAKYFRQHIIPKSENTDPKPHRVSTMSLVSDKQGSISVPSYILDELRQRLSELEKNNDALTCRVKELEKIVLHQGGSVKVDDDNPSSISTSQERGESVATREPSRNRPEDTHYSGTRETTA